MNQKKSLFIEGKTRALCLFAHVLCFNVLFVSCWCVNVYNPSDLIIVCVLAHVLTEQPLARAAKQIETSEVTLIKQMCFN